MEYFGAPVTGISNMVSVDVSSIIVFPRNNVMISGLLVVGTSKKLSFPLRNVILCGVVLIN